MVALTEPFANFFNDHAAGLFRRHVGVVDDLGAERHHQRRGGALAVALVAGGEVFLHAFRRAALGAFVQVASR